MTELRRYTAGIGGAASQRDAAGASSCAMSAPDGLPAVAHAADGICAVGYRVGVFLRDHELGGGRFPLTTMAATSDGASGLSSPWSAGSSVNT